MSMRKAMKRAAALTLAAGMTLALAGCGGKINKFDAAAYMEGLMKETYLGEFTKEYMDLVGITEAEAQATYDNSVEVEAEYFFSIYDIEYPTDELREEVEELYKEIYSHAKFEVISAAEQTDGSFSVKINVEPIDIIQLTDEAWDDAMAPFYEKYPSDVQNAMSDAEYEEMDKEYGQMVVDLVKDQMANIGNQEVQSTTVQLEKDEDGYYAITQEDFSRLNDLIIDYSVN